MKPSRKIWLVAVVVSLAALVAARYAAGVIHVLGSGSPLLRSGVVVREIVSRDVRSDVARVRNRLSMLTSDPVEMQNRNVGEMRVAVTRAELEYTVPSSTVARDSFTVIHGESSDSTSRLHRGDDLSGPSEDGQTALPAWTSTGGGDWARKFSQLRQINRQNVHGLKLVHVVDAASMYGGRWEGNTEAAPLSNGALVYWISADQQLIAVDVESGRAVWHLKVPSFGVSRRGFVLDEDHAGRATLYVPFGRFIAAVDARTGQLVSGARGKGVLALDGWTVVSPIVWDSTLIVALYDKQAIAAIDRRTGTPLWTVPLHPGHRDFEGGAPWGGMAIDRDRALVFVTAGNPRPALSGISRPGDNRNSNSIIAIDLKQRKIKWAFQEVRHDLWDMDLPATPSLSRVTVNRRRYDVVVEPTKMGNTLILDRDTGRPIFDFRLRRAPGSNQIAEYTAPYQPDLERPEPLMGIAFNPAMITDRSPESAAFVQGQLSSEGTVYGRFAPPELNKDLVLFGLHGGAEWPGPAISGDTMYVAVNEIPWLLRVYLQTMPGYLPKLESQPGTRLYSDRCASCHQASRNGYFESSGEAASHFVPALHGYTLSPANRAHFLRERFAARPHHRSERITQDELDQIWKSFETWDVDLFSHGHPALVYHWRQLLDQNRLPGSRPPWGKLVALRLSTGAKIWERPLGEKTIDGRVLQTGSASYGGLVATAGGVIFVVGTDDRYVRAIDAGSGRTLWEYRMAAAGSAPPITFQVNGKQYLCVIATGGKFHNFVDRANQLYIFSL